jgi:cyclophilin family peptidyl-prolyl cis-trans isomerase
VKKLSLIIFMVSSFSGLFSQPILQNEREILQLQDQRSLGNGKLIAALHDPQVQVRYRAAIALANLQDTSTTAALAASLYDTDRRVREASALAMGQMRSDRAADELLSAVPSEKDSTVLAGILEAIGKSGNAKHLDSLLQISEKEPMKFPRTEFAFCIARFALRQIKTERSIWKCFNAAGSESPDECSAALFALWRSAPYGLIDLEISKHKEELIALTHHPRSDIRMHLATLLGRSKTKDSREILDSLELSEKKLNDWHVWIQLIRSRVALSANANEILTRFPEYLAAKNDHIKISALQALSSVQALIADQSIAADSLRSVVRALAYGNAEPEPVRGEALVTLGKHFPKDLELLTPWIADHSISLQLKAKLLEGISQQRSIEHLSILRQNLTHESNRIAMAAWDFIRPMLHPLNLQAFHFDSIAMKELAQDIFQNAKIALRRNDMGITTLVANLFADTMLVKNLLTAGFAGQIVEECLSAYGKLTLADDGEAKQAILQALGTMNDPRVITFLEKEVENPDRAIATEAAASLQHLTGNDYSGRMVQQSIEGRTTEDWRLLESLSPRQHVRLVTNRGAITLELLKDHAPFTVLNFVKLIKKGFYDGLTFHRVVPNFVVQGGDPRGDGWGGPGYTMRTEISTVKYEPGSCGMASAGKDTEGSQFFITHSSTPHLDGRYTIFAKVVQGMDVVDLLQIGDLMKTIQLIQE